MPKICILLHGKGSTLKLTQGTFEFIYPKLQVSWAGISDGKGTSKAIGDIDATTGNSQDKFGDIWGPNWFGVSKNSWFCPQLLIQLLGSITEIIGA